MFFDYDPSIPSFSLESTPVGRLIQRFSKDLDQIDQQLPTSLGQLISSSLSIVSSMVAISIVTPSFGFVMIGISFVYLAITNYYRNVARELKRLEAISRSPIYAHFSETLGGLPVIRGFKRDKLYRQKNEARLDDNISTFNSLKSVDRWLSFRLESLGNVIVLFSALLAVLTGSKAGSAGLSLNNALGVTSLLNWAVRNAAETESLMNSVERVYYTIDETPQEAPTASSPLDSSAYLSDITASHIPTDFQNNSVSESTIPNSVSSRLLPTTEEALLTAGWPWQGGIIFEDVHMRYRDDFEPVLKGVNLKINPGERIGIVGRTGSGKR